MKSFLIIGMGTFGHHLCINLAKQKCEIIVVDHNAEKLEDVLPLVVSAKAADFCDENVVKSFDIPSFDTCFVCVGGNFQSSIQITSLLKDFGAKKIVAKADEDIQARLLSRNGADKVIYPERDIAERIAVSESNSNIFDFFELSRDYGIYEVESPEKWIGKTIKELDIRANYNISILASKRDGELAPMLKPDYIFTKEDHLMVLASKDTIRKLF